MADSRVALITDNLRDALNGKSFTYNSNTYTSTCELQRYQRAIDNRYPFIELAGPWAEVVTRNNVSSQVKLNYLIEFIDSRINDSYIRGHSYLPITEITWNICADIQKLVTSDITRGGYANLTEWTDFGYYFDGDPDHPDIVIYQAVEVMAFLNTTNPYNGGY